MKKAWLGVLLVLGTAYGVNAQEDGAVQGRTNAAANFSDTSASQATLYTTSGTGNFTLATPAVDASANACGNGQSRPNRLRNQRRNTYFLETVTITGGSWEWDSNIYVSSPASLTQTCSG